MSDRDRRSIKDISDYHQKKRDETQEKLLGKISELVQKVDVVKDDVKRDVGSNALDIVTGGYAGFMKDIFKQVSNERKQFQAASDNKQPASNTRTFGNNAGKVSGGVEMSHLRALPSSVSRSDAATKMVEVSQKGFDSLSEKFETGAFETVKYQDTLKDVFGVYGNTQEKIYKGITHQTNQQQWQHNKSEQSSNLRHIEQQSVATRIYRFLLRSNLQGLAKGWNNMLIMLSDFKQNPISTIFRVFGGMLFRKKSYESKDIVKSNDRITKAVLGQATDPSRRGMLGNLLKGQIFDRIFRIDFQQAMKGNFQTTVQTAQKAAYQQMMFGTKSLTDRQQRLMEKHRGRYTGGHRGVDELAGGAEYVKDVNLKDSRAMMEFLKNNGMDGKEWQKILKKMGSGGAWADQDRAARAASRNMAARQQKTSYLLMRAIHKTLERTDSRHAAQAKLLKRMKDIMSNSILGRMLMRFGAGIAALTAAIATRGKGLISAAGGGLKYGAGKVLEKLSSTKVGQAIGSALSKAKGWAAPLWEKISTKVLSPMKNFFLKVLPEKLATGLGKTLSFVFKRLTKFIPGLSAVFGAVDGVMESKERGDSTAATIANAGAQAGGATIGTILGGVIGSALGPVGAIVGATIGGSIGDWVGDNLGDFLAWFIDDFDFMEEVKRHFDGYKSKVLEGWEKVKSKFGELTAWVDQTFFAPVRNFFSSLYEGIQTKMDETKAYIVGKWTDIGNFVSGIGDSIANKYSEIKESIIDKWNSIGDTLFGISIGISTKYGEVKTFMTDTLDSVVKKASDIKTTIVGKFTSIKESVISTFADMKERTIGVAKSWFTDLWNGISNAVRSTTIGRWILGEEDEPQPVDAPPAVQRNVEQRKSAFSSAGSQSVTEAAPTSINNFNQIINRTAEPQDLETVKYIYGL